MVTVVYSGIDAIELEWFEDRARAFSGVNVAVVVAGAGVVDAAVTEG